MTHIIGEAKWHYASVTVFEMCTSLSLSYPEASFSLSKHLARSLKIAALFSSVLYSKLANHFIYYFLFQENELTAPPCAVGQLYLS